MLNSCISCLSSTFFTQKETDSVSTIVYVSIFLPNFTPAPNYPCSYSHYPPLPGAVLSDCWFSDSENQPPAALGMEIMSSHSPDIRPLEMPPVLQWRSEQFRSTHLHSLVFTWTWVSMVSGSIWQGSMGERCSREKSDIPLSLWNSHSTLEDR